MQLKRKEETKHIIKNDKIYHIQINEIGFQHNNGNLQRIINEKKVTVIFKN